MYPEGVLFFIKKQEFTSSLETFYKNDTQFSPPSSKASFKISTSCIVNIYMGNRAPPEMEQGENIDEIMEKYIYSRIQILIEGKVDTVDSMEVKDGTKKYFKCSMKRGKNMLVTLKVIVLWKEVKNVTRVDVVIIFDSKLQVGYKITR